MPLTVERTEDFQLKEHYEGDIPFYGTPDRPELGVVWTEEERARIDAIKARPGRRYALKDKGMLRASRGGHPMPAEKRARVVALLGTMKYYHIAREVGCNPSTVKRIALEEAGLW